MFYHGKLLNGNNVIKDDFRPAYLNGSNTEKLPAERTSNFLDDYSDIGDNGESQVSATTSFTSSATATSSSSSSGNAISSFQETLNRMKNAANDKIQKDIDDKKEREKEEENKIEREKLSSNVTLKPFLFFDLLTSKDSSSQNKEASQSLSNIGTILLFICLILTFFISYSSISLILVSISSLYTLRIIYFFSHVFMYPNFCHIKTNFIAYCIPILCTKIFRFQPVLATFLYYFSSSFFHHCSILIISPSLFLYKSLVY
jgi:hypothetical protein